MNVAHPDPYRAIEESLLRSSTGKARPELTLSEAALPDPATIPPRRWLYGRILIKGFITVLVAPGGVGKTAWSMSVLTAMACGRMLIGDWVYEPQRVLCCTLEDPEDEFNRRLAATMAHHEISRPQLAGRVFVIAGRDRQLLVAALDGDGFTLSYPDKNKLVELVRAKRIGLIIVDPFVNSHELDENNNPHINAAARAWAEIANEAQCAVLLIHHTRKGAGAGDIEASRGAKALTDACRVGLTLTAMTAEEAQGYGISERDRRAFIRLDDAKANLAPPSEKARWFRLVSVDLCNGEPEPPWNEGDRVQAIESWEPPETFSHSSVELNRALDAIAAGPVQGQRYTARRSGAGGGARWCGHALMQVLGIQDGQAAKMVKVWLAEGLLTEREYEDEVQRKTRSGVFVVDAKRPT